jgi:hypothetical protein
MISREGWASLDNARLPHYFVEGRSLCKRWGFDGPPMLLDPNREYGRVCAACAKAAAKRKQEAPGGE